MLTAQILSDKLEAMWAKIQEARKSDQFKASIMYHKYKELEKELESELPPPIPEHIVVEDQAVS